MKTPNQFYAEQVGRPDMGWNVELSEHEFTDVVEAIQLDAFKAGAEWAAKSIEGAPLFSEYILTKASNLKEIPK